MPRSPDNHGQVALSCLNPRQWSSKKFTVIAHGYDHIAHEHDLSLMGSIQRARERTNLSATTEDARRKLDHQLAALSFLAEQLRKQITAGGNNQNG